jgi:hypothetical protein
VIENSNFNYKEVFNLGNPKLMGNDTFNTLFCLYQAWILPQVFKGFLWEKVLVQARKPG